MNNGEKNYTAKDYYFMERALEISGFAAGRTSPNPLVGCVIVKDGLIVGEGFHAKAGCPHAEVNALTAAGENAKDADVYVTLEPCSHYGKTPPCSDALIKANVKRVFVATSDPNPLVAGRGIKKLQDHGIAVTVGLLKEKACRLNEAFLKTVSTGMPFVLYKCALSLDGKTALETGDSSWISNESSREIVHQLRNTYDVIMVGSNTVRTDDPKLNCRLSGGRDPVKLVIDGRLSLSPDSKVLTSSSSTPCIIATTGKAPRDKFTALSRLDNVELWEYTEENVPLATVLQDIAKLGLNSILLEGGGTLAGAMLQQHLIDKIDFFYSSKVIGGTGSSPFSGYLIKKMSEALLISDTTLSQETGDIRMTGYLKY